MGLGENIKDILKKRKMTIKQLAKITGIPINTLYSITKRDTKTARIENLNKIAEALDVNVESLTDNNKIELNRSSRAKIPGTKRIRITKENMDSFKRVFDKVFDYIIESALEDKFNKNVLVYDLKTGQEIEKEVLLKECMEFDDEKKLMLLREMVKEIEINTMMDTLSIVFNEDESQLDSISKIPESEEPPEE